MTPDALHTLTAICTVLEKVGTWPLGTMVLAVMIGPWMFAFIMSRAQEKRFNEMKVMYESNVKLVEAYEALAGTLTDVITLNTAKWQETGDSVKSNQYCPLLRVEKKRVEVGSNEH